MLIKEKLNLTIGECGCGKECQEWDNLMVEKTFNKDGEYVDREVMVHVGYPQNHCHCLCGVEFGKHVCTLVTTAKENCVACGRSIDPKDYDSLGNYCLQCNVDCEVGGRHRVEISELLNRVYGETRNTASSDTGLSEDKQGQERDDEIGDEGGYRGGSSDDNIICEQGGLDGDVSPTY